MQLVVMKVLSLRLLVLLFIIFSLTGTYSKSIKMDSGLERRGQLKTQHGSPVLSVHLRNGGVDFIAYV